MNFMRSGAIFFFLAGLILSGQTFAEKKEQRPNIIVILADDLGYTDIGSYGGEIPTPNLDKLAEKGAVLNNMYASPSCSPTRAMLLSGQDNHRVGFGSMTERIAKNQIGKPGYEGYLNGNVISIATLLRNAGYYTAMAGKWHLGKGKAHSPQKQGFDDSFVLVEGGASHFSDKRGLAASAPIAHYRDKGKLVEKLPEDFFSTRFYTDRILMDIDKSTEKEKPFFVYLAYTAPHWPLQAPDSYLKRSRERYDQGYEILREKRIENLKEIGSLPDNFTPAAPHFSRPWSSLSAEEKRVESRKMEIYAAMIEQMDDEIGRVIAHLKAIGQYDNTFILFLSDNGPAANRADHMHGNEVWIKKTYDNSLENMGRRNSYVFYGPDWAAAGAAPFRGAKGSTSEGGIRVPAIVAYPKLELEGGRRSAIMTVRDIAPTLAEVAGIAPSPSYEGKSFLPYISHQSDHVHAANQVFAWELHGKRSVRQGGWKILWLPKPLGTAQWQLYDLTKDPGESQDLTVAEPEQLRQLLGLWGQYVNQMGVILPDRIDPGF